MRDSASGYGYDRESSGQSCDSKTSKARQPYRPMTTELDFFERNRNGKAGCRRVKKTARAEGLAEGRAKGLAEGKAEGIVEGKTEIAKAMKLAGEPIEKIVLYSGLTEEQIKEF